MTTGKAARGRAPRSGHGDWEPAADLDRLSPRELDVYGRLCGWTLARAHARSGAVAIATFAELYADQNERDYGAFTDAIRAGRLAAEAVPAAA